MKTLFRMGITLAFLLACLTGLWAAQDEIGEIVFIEGSVEIIRNAKSLGSGEVGFGTVIQNFDQLKIGKNGRVDISMFKETGITGEISLKPGTVATIDVTAMKSKQPGSVDLLAGNIAMKVKLADGGRLNVRSGPAAMGVRGTTFEVNVAVNGDVLLSTSEGRVECTAPGLGTPLFSSPGNVVESNGDDDWFSTDVPVDQLDSFRSGWSRKKIDAFRADPGRATLQFAQMYRKSLGDFQSAYVELFKGANNDVVNRWKSEESKGNVGSLAQRNNDKKKLIGPIKKLRKSMFMLERSYYRLVELEELYKQGIAASGQIEQGLSVDAFYRDFAKQKNELSRRLADVNQVFKLYTKRNDGISPMDSSQGFVDADAFMGGSSF